MSLPKLSANEKADLKPHDQAAHRADHTYAVREIFGTLQGEGAQSGTPMVFVRFAGCNLWSGREPDRDRDALRTGALCPRFCDTDFVGGERLGAAEIVARVEALVGPRWICFTGGEPALQLDRPLLERTRAAGYRAAIETNGTIDIANRRDLLDWICVSPKSPNDEELLVRDGDELKLVYSGQSDEAISKYEALAFRHLSLQPEWIADPVIRARHLEGALRFLQRQSRWRLSLQTHKLLGLP